MLQHLHLFPKLFQAQGLAQVFQGFFLFFQLPFQLFKLQHSFMDNLSKNRILPLLYWKPGKKANHIFRNLAFFPRLKSVIIINRLKIKRDFVALWRRIV